MALPGLYGPIASHPGASTDAYGVAAGHLVESVTSGIVTNTARDRDELHGLRHFSL